MRNMYIKIQLFSHKNVNNTSRCPFRMGDQMDKKDGVEDKIGYHSLDELKHLSVTDINK